MNSTFEIAAPNVDELHDTDLDTLIDLHLFDCDAWCHEHCLVTPDNAVAACLACGYTEELRCAGPHFDISAPHPRRVPRYTANMSAAWKIVEKIKMCSVSVRVLFEIRVGNQCSSRISKLTPRMVAVAALQAIGVVDYKGFMIIRGGE